MAKIGVNFGCKLQIKTKNWADLCSDLHKILLSTYQQLGHIV